MYGEMFKEEDRLLNQLQESIIRQTINNQEKFIEDVLRNHVTPPIKGEITKGKIKWRGLEIMNDTAYSKLWVRQRGVDIPIYLDYSFKLF
jgi:hypothetical protein